MVVCSPVRWLTVNPPSTPGTSWLRSRMLANVPRIITSWLPRREPYELKSLRSTPCSMRYRPAGESGLMEPAGEMWSVVTESPSQASTRAPVMSVTGAGCGVMPSKYGGLRTYVGVDAPLEVAVAGQHADHGEVMLVDGRGDLLRQRAGVADAGGAAVPDQVEAELVQ